ncbi:hypothetical protein COV82_02800 [Candidatus Peregrinibacteria bacterium CG11_big_fil_rev_8_21_14_0_20_46_8]|nr:MAG: hypothetical protein COV82_02800 [Candidatus Peregrinibacteria bacterium CG11_big_fil_rev_8_21_14_0_20_46_8]
MPDSPQNQEPQPATPAPPATPNGPRRPEEAGRLTQLVEKGTYATVGAIASAIKRAALGVISVAEGVVTIPVGIVAAPFQAVAQAGKELVQPLNLAKRDGATGALITAGEATGEVAGKRIVGGAVKTVPNTLGRIGAALIAPFQRAWRRMRHGTWASGKTAEPTRGGDETTGATPSAA